MRELTMITIVILALVLALTPVDAITFGQPDGNRHPNVGLTLTDVGRDTL